ncbi:UDP-N-acetylmuramoyl-L-alanine--D-glutamate ligase [Ammoniphilus resinae]|uniref:UDP-N-acetylmuramoylalanine--D-glutamate ligase n=1 Tax=Ammoniphilus resinae TaxID=861532 RepID=A0ABS4GKH8_9BACL|nr:UDP-N-acetylmuramoyl-L-alanine--D-glutamate ligase [Ammoniphilus resinae]MBP1930657.1 UDP-N-acetylmuramoylalanine--D-glutamate ligase [Ammoniphilus resinae]
MEYGREWIKNKNVLVLGLAKSGLAVSKLLIRLGAHVTVNDQKEEHPENHLSELKALGVKVILGGHPEGLIHKGIDLIVKNPGIPYTAGPVQEGIKTEIPIITEVELAYWISKSPIVGITGSNGKTTTTTLVGEILAKANRAPIVAGNIGTVLCEQAETVKEDQVLVAELSSFQLKGTLLFQPQVACLLNVIPAHLDYHKTWEDYITSKGKLFSNMTADQIGVFNADNEGARDVASTAPCQVMWFSRLQSVDFGAYVENEAIVFRSEQGKEEIIAISQIAIPGTHNLENALAATAICKSLGVEGKIIAEVLASFQGVEHRLEFVSEIDMVKYYNDSKATNSSATMKALQSFQNPIVLIAGGLDRGYDFMELIPMLKERVKGLVAYGQTKERFRHIGELAGLKYLVIVDTVEQAVLEARKVANAGDIVLLSPACASWDMHASFEERGSIFKESVHMLKTSPNK